MNANSKHFDADLKKKGINLSSVYQKADNEFMMCCCCCK